MYPSGSAYIPMRNMFETVKSRYITKLPALTKLRHLVCCRNIHRPENKGRDGGVPSAGIRKTRPTELEQVFPGLLIQGFPYIIVNQRYADVLKYLGRAGHKVDELEAEEKFFQQQPGLLRNNHLPFILHNVRTA